MSNTWIAALTGNVIGFVAGTCLTWTSPELPILEGNSTVDSPLDKIYDKDSQEIAWIGSLLALGATFGPILWGYLANAIGRKNTILGMSIPFCLSYILLAFTKNMICFLLARLLIGLSIGGVFTVLPMYLAEVATDANRGAIGASMNCFICFGLLFSYSVGPYIPWIYFNLILAICPAAFVVLFFFVAPETPHYLISKCEIKQAKENLAKLRGHDADEEFKEIQEAIENSTTGTLSDLFKEVANRKALIISVGLVSFQQLSGINAVLFFAQDIFTDAGVDSIKPEVCSILVGLTQFVTSFITPLVSDRLGRKILLIFSAIGMLISEVPLGLFFYLKQMGHDVSNIAFLPILCLITYIITYNCGFGPLPWSVMAEVFPSNVKSIANTLTASACWFIGFLITYFFPAIVKAIHQYSAFWIFAACSGAAGLFSIFYVIETKGKNVTEIQRILSS